MSDMSRLRVGAGNDPATEVGPLVTRAQQQRVLNYLDIGVAEGPASPRRHHCRKTARSRTGSSSPQP
jgi:acyl-CoA reductase-like NAD-dependent aldehyde dehydrogenase